MTFFWSLISHLLVDNNHKIYTKDRNYKEPVFYNDKDVLEQNEFMAGVVSDGAESDVGPGCLACTLHWHWQGPKTKFWIRKNSCPVAFV